MSFYKERILPKMIDLVCNAGPMTRQRKKIIHRASGNVLEIGVGTGLNLPFYDTGKIISLTGLEPSPGMAQVACRRAQTIDIEFKLLAAGAESIPVASASIDAVVMTYTLCTISDPRRAIREIYRILKPGGFFYFCEHGLAPDLKTRRLQNRLTPVWKLIAGGCHLNRDIEALIKNGGFFMHEMETLYLPGWRPASFNYLGMAERGQRTVYPKKH